MLAAKSMGSSRPASWIFLTITSGSDERGIIGMCQLILHEDSELNI